MIEDKLELNHLKAEFDNMPTGEKENAKEHTTQQLKLLSELWLHQNKEDKVQLFKLIGEIIGYNSSLDNNVFGEDVLHLINDKDQLITVIANDDPDAEQIQNIREHINETSPSKVI